jgi:methylmalonyl-CoA mutase N-terminal domain/subunit
LIERVDQMGGAAKAIEAGFFQEEIAASAYAHQLRIESGQTVVVGVNHFADGEEPPVIPAPDFRALEAHQIASLAQRRATRDGAAVKAALDAIRTNAATVGDASSLMPSIITAVRVRATVGEISDALESQWGRYAAVR